MLHHPKSTLPILQVFSDRQDTTQFHTKEAATLIYFPSSTTTLVLSVPGARLVFALWWAQPFPGRQRIMSIVVETYYHRHRHSAADVVPFSSPFSSFVMLRLIIPDSHHHM